MVADKKTSFFAAATTTFAVTIQKNSNCFEILESGTVIVTGTVEACCRQGLQENVDPELLKNPSNEPEIILSSKDVYKELRLRGYHYSGAFRGLEDVDSAGNCFN